MFRLLLAIGTLLRFKKVWLHSAGAAIARFCHVILSPRCAAAKNTSSKVRLRLCLSRASHCRLCLHCIFSIASRKFGVASRYAASFAASCRNINPRFRANPFMWYNTIIKSSEPTLSRAWTGGNCATPRDGIAR
jgi:hypothetical protein